MTRLLLTVLSFALLPVQTAPPATDVYLAPLTSDGKTLKVGKPENISNSPGYDTQPFFSPDERSLYFTSARGNVVSKCGSPQSDVYRFDLGSRAIAQVTETAECEYSPTVTPDGRHVSVIQVEPDGTQRLWKFTLEGKSPTVVLDAVKPVGYHAWLSETMLALFVLGQPATLQVADTTTGKAVVVATDIGQSIVRIPGGGASFVQQAGEGDARTLTISQVTLANGKPVVEPLVPAVSGARQVHVAWTPDRTLLMAHGGALHAWRGEGDAWQTVADLSALGLRNVTRLAVSPKGDRIAFVATP
jgi:hypothetical protein